MSSKEFRLLYEAVLALHARMDELASPPSQEVLLNSNEMCTLLKCSSSTLRRLRNKGTIPCNQVGRSYYYPKNYFTQEFLNSIIKVEDASKKFDD